MNKKPRFLSSDFSLKRVLILVAAIEIVLAVALYVYYDRFQDEFSLSRQRRRHRHRRRRTPADRLRRGAARPMDLFRRRHRHPASQRAAVPAHAVQGHDRHHGPAARDRMLTIQSILREAEEAYRGEDTRARGSKPSPSPWRITWACSCPR